MAATHLRNRTGSQPPPPPEETEAQTPEKTTGAKKTGKHDDGLAFWELVSSLTEDQWSEHICYWYRLGPKIDRSTSGRGLSIKTTAHAFTLDQVMKEEGSGVYRFDLLRRDPTTGKSSLVLRHYDQILNMSYPPRVPYGPWIGESENALWKWAEEPLKVKDVASQARVDALENGGAGVAADPSQIFTTILEGVKTLRPDQPENAGGVAGSLLAIVLKNQETMAAMMDPTKQLTTIKTLMDHFQPQQKGTDASTLMLEFMKDQMSSMRDELKEMRLNASKPRNFLEELKEFSTVFTEVAPALGFNKRGPTGTPNPANGNGGTDWGSVIEKVLDKGGVYVPLLTAAIQRGSGAPTPQLPGHPPASYDAALASHAAQPATGQPQSNPGGTIDMNAIPPEERQAVAQLEAKMTAFLAKHGELLRHVAPFAIDGFRAQESGKHLRDWFLNRHGRMVWVTFREDSGADVLTALCGRDPFLKTVFTPIEKVMVYFADFFADPEDDEEDEDETGDTLPVGHRGTDNAA